MSGATWRPEELAILDAAIEAGVKPIDLQPRIDRTVDAIRSKYLYRTRETEAAKHVAPAVSASDAPPTAGEVLAKLKAPAPPQAVVTPQWDADGQGKDIARLWAEAEVVNKEKIERAHKLSLFKVDLPGEPCAIVFASDQHIAPGTPVDLERMMEDALLITETPNMFVCLGGDGVDNHIKHRAAIMAARSQPGDQYELYEYYIQVLAPSLLAMISGNHDAWTDQHAGVDVVQQIAQRNKIAYCPAEARLDVNVGEQNYKVAFRHQYRYNSSFNMTHAVKQWYRMGDATFDLGCICHHHEPSIEAFTAHGLERWACRPGSYQITSAYSRQYGYNSTKPTCPTFVIYPDRRKILGFQDVRDGAMFLKAELGR